MTNSRGYSTRKQRNAPVVPGKPKTAPGKLSPERRRELLDEWEKLKPHQKENWALILTGL